MTDEPEHPDFNEQVRATYDERRKPTRELQDRLAQPPPDEDSQEDDDDQAGH
jgi:hypothetical protein